MRRPLGAALFCAILTAACRPATPTSSVRAEFLLSTRDSTFWVRGDQTGIHVRGAPLLLARFDGRFHDVWLDDDDRSFDEAIFDADRAFQRDLLSRDSTIIFEDSALARAAAAWGAAHPGARHLAPDDDAPDNPAMDMESSFDVVALHGPFLSFEHHTDVERGNEPARHHTTRGVIDLRTGRQVDLADLVGPGDAAGITERARASMRDAIESIRRDPNARAREVADALSAFSFDERSFSILSRAGQPWIAFAAPGDGQGAAGFTMPIEPVPVPTLPGWDSIAMSLPSVETDTLSEWRGTRYTVIAIADSSGDEARVQLRAGTHSWTVTSVAGPVERVHRLDDQPLDDASRRALARAFDEAAEYGEDARSASAPAPPRTDPSVSFAYHDLITSQRTHRASLQTPACQPARNVRAHDAGRCQQPRSRIRRGGARHDGQVRGDCGVPSLPRERGDRVHRPRGLS